MTLFKNKCRKRLYNLIDTVPHLSIYKGKNQKDNSNLVIIPSAAGRPVSICKSDIGSKNTWNSCSHGTGRIYDRPKLKLKRFKNKPIDEIIKNGNKILYNKIDLNTEHPKAFKKSFKCN